MVSDMHHTLSLNPPSVPFLARMRDWAGLTGRGACRSRRMMILITSIIVLSIADLVVTVTHLRTIGMIEANPIAAYLIVTYQSAWVLAGYKLLTVGVCIVALYSIRERILGEVAAWASVCILVGMAVVWHLYAAELDQPEAYEMVKYASVDEQWLFLR